MSQTKVTDNLRDVTQVDAAKITTGTIPEARIATLDATKLTGTIAVGSLFASGDKGADIASAATVVIGTDGSYFDITGTTGISTQFTVAAGRRFTLQFDGAVTITDNAAITLSGAANFTTAAGDILSFVAVAANTVVQTGYSLVDGGSPVAASSEATYVQFPATQVASADANRLDDYEEGTWTPDLTAATNNNHTRSTQVGYYTKVGNMVMVSGGIVTGVAGSSSGNTSITGLPFTIKNVSSHQPVMSFGNSDSMALSAAGYSITAAGNTNSTACNIRTWDGTGGTSLTQFSEFGDYNTITLSMTYMTA